MTATQLAVGNRDMRASWYVYQRMALLVGGISFLEFDTKEAPMHHVAVATPPTSTQNLPRDKWSKGAKGSFTEKGIRVLLAQ